MTIKIEWEEGIDSPQEIRPGKCLSSVPCGDDCFDHKEHSLCLNCKRRVPVPLDARAIVNSVWTCSKCDPSGALRGLASMMVKFGEPT